MTTVRHVAHAAGSPGSTDHACRRTITVPADLPTPQVEALGSVAERTPVTLAVRAGTPITTTFRGGQ